MELQALSLANIPAAWAEPGKWDLAHFSPVSVLVHPSNLLSPPGTSVKSPGDSGQVLAGGGLWTSQPSPWPGPAVPSGSL